MILQEELKKMNRDFKILLKKIQEYDTIIIYRHKSPDFDALGSQYGLKMWIQDNFKDKKVYAVGDLHPTLFESLYPLPDNLTESDYNKKHLAIVCDVSNRKRIACDNLRYAAEVIKLDHHNPPLIEEDYGDYKIVYADRPAASEIIALFALSRPKKYKIMKMCASYLYSGIVGDTGRFQYQDTDGATLRVAASLLDLGADKDFVYSKMYETDTRRLAILSYCLNNYQITDKGVCYFIFKDEDLKKLNMTVDEGNLYINTFRSLKDVKAVLSVTYDEVHSDYRVSLRSQNLVLYTAAKAFGGGGHDYAAGCHLKTLDDLPKLLEAVGSLE